ncbi:MAG: 5'-nucleotidase [Butyrivibrio sp.]|nr:5'-nucleotidase [Acetatifactor muris]MCM1561523.1 5'-nucleotidase [Butyrivibrio sp.]
MAYVMNQKMVIGVSSRALFDLTVENEIFETRGLEAYCQYQVEHEQEILRPGPGFRLIQSLLQLNECVEERNLIEVIIMSHNSPDTSLRVFNTIAHYGLPITRSVLASGASLAPYLAAFGTDLYLSACEEDVQSAIDSGIAAGIICTGGPGECGEREKTAARRDSKIIPLSDASCRALPGGSCRVSADASCRALSGAPCRALPGASCQAASVPVESAAASFVAAPLAPGQIRIAFDGDAVLFADESEAIFQEKGLNAFEENEKAHASEPLAEGPFASFLKKLSDLQRELGTENCPVRTALVTSRSAPAHERVIRTMRAWNVRVDEAFFLGGLEKREFLKAFGAQIFFDDQSVHTQSAAQAVPAARVPYRRKGEMYRFAR